MTTTQAQAAMQRSRSDLPALGEILVKAGKLQPQDVDRILALHQSDQLRFGEAAVKLQLVSEGDVQSALATQFQYPAASTSSELRVSKELFAAWEPMSARAEKLRSLRTQLLLQRLHDDQNAVAVVSAHAGDGRSHLAGNLAVSFAQLGRRTLLIDADLRAPRQHKLFETAQSGGLAALLSGRLASHEAMTPVPGLGQLYLLPAGAVPNNPLELLSEERFRNLLDEAREAFDTIILDTPAADECADCLAVAAQARTALLAVRRDHSELAASRKLAADISAGGANLVGSVILEP